MRGNLRKNSHFAYKDGQCVFTLREEGAQEAQMSSRPSTVSKHPLSVPSFEWKSWKAATGTRCDS